MQDQLRARLEQLQQEYQKGQEELRLLEMQQAQLQQTLLRISGAIQVLAELLAAPEGSDGSAAQPVETK